ncbi:hypothetical protein F383_25297 [Gossypium arboreum]|uniref:Uncharacterized protein n=1 Tax=Gossypium arboreum TaxID=29729 RepID=A0A0B0P8L9_GOSAR|nr:hypothetical protein F383_25297 [Gossypium arboreum]
MSLLHSRYTTTSKEGQLLQANFGPISNPITSNPKTQISNPNPVGPFTTTTNQPKLPI